MTKLIYASFMRRLAAVLIDHAVFGFAVLSTGFVLIFPALLMGFFSMISMVTITLFTLLIWVGGSALFLGLHWLYYAGFEASTLQATPGKLAMGLRVCDEQQQRLSLRQSSIRYLSRFLSNLLCYAGYLLALFTGKKQTLHDLISHSLVVRIDPQLQSQASEP